MNEAILNIMAAEGFLVWGGDWQDRVDYMHFQVPTNTVYHLSQMDKKSGQTFIQLMSQYPESAKNMSADSRWDYLYEMYPENYINALKKYFPLLKTRPETEVIDYIYQDLALNTNSR